jgi:transcriptional regulator
VDDAPDRFVETQLRGIVGIEIAVSAMAGKWKVSQNRPENDRKGVHTGLASDGKTEMAELVWRYGGL